MNLTTIITDTIVRHKIVKMYTENLYRPASYVLFPLSGKSITAISDRTENTWFERAPRINSIINISGYLLQDLLKIFGFGNCVSMDLAALPNLLLDRPVAEIGKREELVESDIVCLLVKEINGGVNIAVILESGELQESRHTEPFHIVFDGDFSQLEALKKEVNHG